jgi:hypothetical protein
MESMAADISARLAIGAAACSMLPAQAGRGIMEPAKKLAIARIDSSREM